MELIYSNNFDEREYNEHCCEKYFGTNFLAYWDEMKSEISHGQHPLPYGEVIQFISYDPFSTANPHTVIGLGNCTYGNTSNFDLSIIPGRYWKFRWLQRWMPDYEAFGRCANKLLYINGQQHGAFRATVQRVFSSKPQEFLVRIRDRNHGSMYKQKYVEYNGFLGGFFGWTVMELQLDLGTAALPGSFELFINNQSIINESFQLSLVPDCPIEFLTGWPSNISGTPDCIGNGWTAQAKQRIYVSSAGFD